MSNQTVFIASEQTNLVTNVGTCLNHEELVKIFTREPEMVDAPKLPKTMRLVDIDLAGVKVVRFMKQWYQVVTGGFICIDGPGDLREDPVIYS